MTKTYTHTIIAIFLAVSALLAYSFTGAWTPPPANPPQGNTTAPINVGPDAQVKAGNIGANILLASSSVWSDQYCDSNGENCTAGSAGPNIPGPDEVGSFVLAAVSPDVLLSSIQFGQIIAGRYLCPAGLFVANGTVNNENIIRMDTGRAGADFVCWSALTGSYQSLGFSDIKPRTWVAGGSSQIVTLFQKISNKEGRLCNIKVSWGFPSGSGNKTVVMQGDSSDRVAIGLNYDNGDSGKNYSYYPVNPMSAIYTEVVGTGSWTGIFRRQNDHDDSLLPARATTGVIDALSYSAHRSTVDGYNTYDHIVIKPLQLAVGQTVSLTNKSMVGIGTNELNVTAEVVSCTN